MIEIHIFARNDLRSWQLGNACFCLGNLMRLNQQDPGRQESLLDLPVIVHAVGADELQTLVERADLLGEPHAVFPFEAFSMYNKALGSVTNTTPAMLAVSVASTIARDEFATYPLWR
jgi:hypothetical protein